MSKATLAALDRAILAHQAKPSPKTHETLIACGQAHVLDLFLREQEEALTGRIIKNDE